MLLTARPDLLPIDLKRQGRAEVHIPLFYPTDEGEIRQMFVILAKKLGIARRARGRPADSAARASVGRRHRGHGRPRVAQVAARRRRITSRSEALAEVVSQFMPSTQGLERELQEIAAIIECTDRQFLPPAILERMDKEGGRATFQARLTALKQIVKDL